MDNAVTEGRAADSGELAAQKLVCLAEHTYNQALNPPDSAELQVSLRYCQTEITESGDSFTKPWVAVVNIVKAKFRRTQNCHRTSTVVHALEVLRIVSRSRENVGVYYGGCCGAEVGAHPELQAVEMWVSVFATSTRCNLRCDTMARYATPGQMQC